MLAADTLGSYGSLARFMDVQRLQKVGDNAVVGAGGDLSDWQYIQHMMDNLMYVCVPVCVAYPCSQQERNEFDGHKLQPRQVYAYLSQVMYERRSKMDPLWNALILGGYDTKTSESFLGYVDLLGTTYQSSTIATGFGLHLAQPMLRKAVEGRESELTEQEARKIVEDCMKVLCAYLAIAHMLTLVYRDARSINRVRTCLLRCSHSVSHCYDHCSWPTYLRAHQRRDQLGLCRGSAWLRTPDTIGYRRNLGTSASL